MISEDSMRDKKQRTRTAINQVIKMRLMTGESLEKILPERKRGKYPGTTKGNVVGYIGLSPNSCLLYTSPSPRDGLLSRMPSSA